MGKDLFVFRLSEDAEFPENKNYPEYSNEQLLKASLTKSEELAGIKDITTLERLNKLSRICRDSLLTDEQKIALSEYYTDPKNITVEPGSNISVVIDIINNVRHSHIWFNLASTDATFFDIYKAATGDILTNDIGWDILKQLSPADYVHTVKSNRPGYSCNDLLVFQPKHELKLPGAKYVLDEITIYVKLDLTSEERYGIVLASFHDPKFKATGSYEDGDR